MFLNDNETESSISELINNHLSMLLKEFERYFPPSKYPRNGKEWIRNPFVKKPVELRISVEQQAKLLEIKNDGDLKSIGFRKN